MMVHIISAFFISMGLMSQLAANGSSVAVSSIVPMIINIVILPILNEPIIP